MKQRAGSSKFQWLQNISPASYIGQSIGSAPV